MSYTPRHARASTLPRRVATLAASAVFVGASLVSPHFAHAQDMGTSSEPFNAASSAGDLEGFMAGVNATLERTARQADSNARSTAWNMRNGLREQANALAVVNPQLPEQARVQIDQAVEAFFPGLIAEKSPAPAPAPVPAPAPAREPVQEAAPAPAPAPQFDYGSCPKDARACVDIAGQRSWLQSNGQNSYGAVHIATGMPGHETPPGTFYVNRKVKDEISFEFNNAPMPNAVYFTYNGIAFHEGDPAYESHGCVRMYREDAERYFNELQIGDKVYVY